MPEDVPKEPLTVACAVTGKQFDLSVTDLQCLDRLSPEIAGVKYPLPLPQLCPEERKRRRLAFRNERFLYHSTCAMTGKRIITFFSPDKPYKVYSPKAWWSDAWDARTYGREFDFSRPFFEQFAELKLEVPQLALVATPDAEDANCPYVNFAGNNKNCHMIFDSDFNDECLLSNVIKHSRDCLDCSYVHSSELCYECIDCYNCYALAYSQDCTDCRASSFLQNCIGCTDCFMCANLTQKRYHIENKPYTKEDYEARLEKYNLKSRTGIESCIKRLAGFHLAYPKKYCHILRSEDCSGDYIQLSRRVTNSFNISDGEDLRYCDSVYSAKDCMDVSSFGEHIECTYNSGTIGVNCFNILMSYVVVLNCSDLIYCDNARQSQNCFGCCGVRRNEFCVLNKQYSKDDYEKLVAKIIEHMKETGEWGEYFPIDHSPFGYNETMAQEILPLTKEEALQLGANWSDYQPPAPEVEVISPSMVPNCIDNVDDKILEQAISCPVSGRAWRATLPELRFLRNRSLPFPVLHPDERHKRRISLRSPQKLWLRHCAKTGEELLSSYDPERPEIVYSEKAFQDALQ